MIFAIVITSVFQTKLIDKKKTPASPTRAAVATRRRPSKTRAAVIHILYCIM
jgi:hypothetical protein